MSRYFSLLLMFTCCITIHLSGQGSGSVYAKKQLKPKVEVTYAEKLGTIPPLQELIPAKPTSSLKRNLAKKNRKGPKDFPGRGRNKIIRPELEHQGVDAIRQTSFNANYNTIVQPSVNINGLTSGFAPNDPTGDIGENHYLQAINFTTLGVFDKNGTLLSSFTANTLWNPLGFSSAGDPIILYDQQSKRWIITEFPDENQLLVAISADADPRSSYDVYNFATPEFPDYPKYGIWEDVITVSTNEGSPGTHSIYIMDKVALMAGAPTVTIQRLELPGNTNTEAGFFVTTPLDWTGRNEPIGGPMFITLNDSSWGMSEEDQVEVYTIDIDFSNPDNTTFDNTSIVLAPFDGFPCSVADGFSFACVPQLGGDGLDAIPEVIMNQAHYRNFISHESMVFNFITDVTDGANLSGIRWVELRRIPEGEWSLYQEGTFAPDDGLDRFMGSICMDGDGNIGLAYNVSSEDTYVGVRFTGRRFSDPLGEMTVEEFIVAEGTNAINSGGRFGDYAHMTIDPLDDKTFWFTTEYANADDGGDVNTRIVAFSIDLDSTDIGVTNLLTPQNASNLSSNENITIQVTNFGLDTQTTFQVGYIFQGQAPIIETVNETILPGGMFEYTFSSTVNMNEIGDYDFKLFTSLSGDETISNDTLKTTVTHLPNRDISIVGIEGLSGQNCVASFPINILLANNGGDALNSVSLDIVLNDTLLTTINWTGNLESGQQEAVPFELMDFVNGMNQITVTANSPNGAADEIPADNAFSTEFTAIVDGVSVILTLTLDEFPEETSWMIMDNSGNTIASAGPYPAFPAAPTIQETFCLDPAACYTFTILDAQGDGICCSFGFGNYNITDASGNILLASEGIFNSSETNDFCASLPNRDISITGIEGLSSQNCTADLPVNIDILLLNNGLDLLNSATVDIVLNDTFLTTIDWTGSLATGETETVSYELVGLIDGVNQITATAAMPNGLTDEKPSDNTFSTEVIIAGADGVSTVLTLNLDDFPTETSWTLANDEGNIIASNGPYPFFLSNSTIQEEFCLAPNTCYSFTILDSEEDGICCFFGNGSYNLTDASGNVLFASDGRFSASETNEFCLGLNCTITANIDIDKTGASTADAQDGSILIVIDDTNASYQYSIDNGQTFQESPLFNDLGMGTYAILVRDNMGCTFEETVSIDIVSSTAEIEPTQIFLAYPNPTDGIFNLEVSGLAHPSVFLNIEVYNTAGERVQTSKLGKYGTSFKGQVSLYHYPSGTYLIRFANAAAISKMVKVVRL